MDVFQNVGSDHRVQISVHEIKHQVDITVVFGADHILQANDIFVARQFLQEDDLAEGALRVSRILKCVEVFL